MTVKNRVCRSLVIDIDTWEKTKLYAKSCGRSVSSYIESILEYKVPKQIPPKEYHKLYLEIAAIGNNINQMAKLSHQKGCCNYKDFEKDLEIVKAMQVRLKELATKEVDILEEDIEAKMIITHKK